MNFEDEPYVRLYTRDTKTWLRLGFEGQAVLMLTLRKLDRSGVLDDIDNADDLALVIGAPPEVVRVGLERVLERGVFTLSGGRLVMPKFLEAQNARLSDRLRQRESRARRRSVALSTVTNRDSESRSVTESHQPSHGVTPCHSSLAELSLAETSSLSPLPPKGAGERDPGVIPVRYHRIPDGWVPNARTKAHAQELGFSVEEFKEVLAWVRNQYYERAFLDPDRHVQQVLTRWRRNKETEQAKDLERERGARANAR